MARAHLAVAAVLTAWLIAEAASVAAGASWWRMVHPITLGVVTTAILVYSTHFCDALTRSHTSGTPLVIRVVLVQVAAVTLYLVDPATGWNLLADAAAALLGITGAWHALALARRLRAAISPSPLARIVVAYYVAALGALIAAIIAARLGYTQVHSRLAVWGFVWLTVQATVVTLVPTFAGTSISTTASARLPRALVISCAGLAVLAVGLPWGQLVVAVAGVLVVQPVIAGALAGSAPVGVVAALVWFPALCVADVVAGQTQVVLPTLLGAGLVQLVTGVLIVLLPRLTLRRPGPDRWAVPRAVVINAGGVVALVWAGPGAAVMAAGLAWQLATLIARVVRR